MKTIMTVRAYPSRKYLAIFFFLAVVVLYLVLYNFQVLEFQQEVNFTRPVSRGNKDPEIHRSFCTLQPLSPKDAVEESVLLDSITWPEAPYQSAPLALDQTSDPAHSTFTILPRSGGGQWHVGDQLEVLIKMSDFQGRPKKFGGDLLFAKLHNQKLGAGVAGQVVDHLNGSYSAVFSLLWDGDAQVQVMLDHPSEAIQALNRLTREQPDRVYFKSVFRSGSVSETTTCNVCLRPTQRPVCNYTDLRTGEPWFCYKPMKLSCGARISHAMAGFTQNLKPNEIKLFQSGVNLKVYVPASGPANVTVLPKREGQQDMKTSLVKSGLSGYYYQGVWRALDGTKVHQFNDPSAISQCLRGKVVHLYGDSTIRQWFEYFNAILPDLKKFDLHSQKQIGPFMALDYANNILVTFRCHGPPIRFGIVPISEFHYIANELDGILGGTNTVVVIGVWSHFGTFPMEIYIRRLQNIRRAVLRLLGRAPGTLVIIRTANPKALWLYETLTNSDWFSLQRDKVLRAMFKGMNVHLIDAWEMVLAHELPHSLHPQPPIIKNMIDVLLSYTCPEKGS